MKLRRFCPEISALWPPAEARRAGRKPPAGLPPPVR
jgi:hypothetical protein